MKHLTLLIGLGVVAACGGSDSKGTMGPTAPTPAPPVTPAETAPVVAATPMLASAEMSIGIGGRDAMRMFADGRIEANIDDTWTHIGMLKDDAMWDKNENKIMWVDSEGLVSLADPNAPKLRFTGNALTVGPNTIAVGDDGIMTGLNPDAEGSVRVVGAVTDENKRAAVLLTLAMMMISQAPPAN